MRTKLVVLFVVAAVIGLTAGTLHVARAATPIPAIITFSSSVPSISVDDAEAGTVSTTLSWHVINVDAQYRLTLHTYRLNAWQVVFDAESVPLEPVGSRTVTIQHPLNFGPPVYLLSVIDAQSRIVDQRPLVIPYTQEVEAPVISTFTTAVESVDAAALADGTARVTVSWQVDGRVATSNLIFEQVFEDGTAASVELDRPNLWVPSDGEGPVAPVAREGEQAIRLRLRVTDVITGDVYAEQTLDLPIASVTSSLPVTTPAPVAATLPPQATTADIVSFTASPDVVNPGAAVTLAWEVRGTGGVTIDLAIPNRPAVETVVNALSPKGSATVYLPDFAAYSVEFVLRMENTTEAATASVAIHCPYTFFFGEADGCPLAEPGDVEAAYQEFEGGMMVWRGDTQEIYVFYTDGTAGDYLESSYSNMPESDLAELPPLDREAPLHGFGKVWANAPGVQDKLGWALAPEEGYTMQLQPVATTRIPAPVFLFYLTLPGGRVVGTGSGLWEIVK